MRYPIGMSFTPTITQGDRLYVRGMAASSIASRTYAVSTHDECGTEVAWAQSSRTGKWYPCEVAEYATEAGNRKHRAMPYKPHTCPTPSDPALDEWARKQTMTEDEKRTEAAEVFLNAAASIEDINPDVAAKLRADAQAMREVVA